MASLSEEEEVNTLPPVFYLNSRQKILPEQVSLESITLALAKNKKHSEQDEIESLPPPEPSLPCPRYPIAIIWSPDRPYFQLDEKPIIQKLWLWNGSDRMIYIHCCGLWNEQARLGASWLTYPRTRFHLAPGLKTDLFVKATPRAESPVPSALVALQLAASHMRDVVTGYFCIPIFVEFLNYKAPVFDYGE